MSRTVARRRFVRLRAAGFSPEKRDMTATIAAAVLCIAVGIELVRRSRRPRRARVAKPHRHSR